MRRLPLQVTGGSFQVAGIPSNLVFARPTNSPNATINEEEDGRQALQASLIPSGHQTSLPSEFFFSVSPPKTFTSQAHSLHLGNSSGGVRRVIELPPDVTATAVFYNSSVQHLVCITSDHMMTTHSEQDGDWKVLTRMRFSAQRVTSTKRALLSAWTGAPPGNTVNSSVRARPCLSAQQGSIEGLAIWCGWHNFDAPSHTLLELC
jgi:hypothetical protein